MDENPYSTKIPISLLPDPLPANVGSWEYERRLSLEEVLRSRMTFLEVELARVREDHAALEAERNSESRLASQYMAERDAAREIASNANAEMCRWREEAGRLTVALTAALRAAAAKLEASQ